MPTEEIASKSDVELNMLMDHATFLAELREGLEADSNEKNASTIESIRQAETAASTKAWEKAIKKNPGICRYLSGNGAKKLAADIKKLDSAVKKLDAKSEKSRKAAAKAIVTVIALFSGFPVLGMSLAPWLTEASWTIFKWQVKQLHKVANWIAKNLDNVGDNLDKLKAVCKKVKPTLPDKIEKVIKESK